MPQPISLTFVCCIATAADNFVDTEQPTWSCYLQDIEPNFFLALLLPLILYAAAISMHWHTLRRCLFQVRSNLPSLPGVESPTSLTVAD